MAMVNWLLLLVLLYVLYRSVRPSFQLRKARTEPTCAACGYAVVGLTTSICPECGKDLLVTGIVPTGKMGLRIGNGVAGTFLLFLVFAFSCMVVGLIRHYTCDASFDISPSTSSMESLVILDCYAEGFSEHLSPDMVDVFGFGPPKVPHAVAPFGRSHGDSSWQGTVPDGPRGSISFDHRAGDWILTDPARSHRVSSLTDAEIDAWLVAIGVPSDLPRSHELVQVINAVKGTSDLYSFDLPPMTSWANGGKSRGSSSGPSNALLAIDAWFFAFIWAWSLRHTLFGKRKALRGIEAAHVLSQPVN
jgi:hypothetical protein